jgi:multimeric flavodoxin WrbA
MRLTIFNGSPRGKKSNSKVLIEQFLRGFIETEGNTYEIFYLNRVNDAAAFQQAFAKADYVLLATPLYTDSMPGVVMAFIEALQPFVGQEGNPPIGFIVQSGFPEAGHSRPLERYFEKLSSRLGSPYLGTIIKGGAEGIQIQHEKMTHKLFEAFYQIGHHFGVTGEFDQGLVTRLAKPEHYPKWSIPIFKVLLKTNFGKFYWNMQLKENGAYENRFAQPFA